MSPPRPTPPPGCVPSHPASSPDLRDLGPLPVGSLGTGFPGSEHGLGFILGLCLGSSPLGPLGTACFAPASCPIPLLGPQLHLRVRSAGRVRHPPGQEVPRWPAPLGGSCPRESQGYASLWWPTVEVPLPIQGREGLAPGAGAQGAGQWPVLRPLPPAELPPPQTPRVTQDAAAQGIGSPAAPGAGAPFIALLWPSREKPVPQVPAWPARHPQ